MSVSKAHIKASNKYNKENYRKFQADIKPEDLEEIEKYCEEHGISKAQFLIRSSRYIISNGIKL